MSKRNRFFYIVCSTTLSLLSVSLMANPSVPAPKPITDDRPNIGQSDSSNSTQLSRNKSGAGVTSPALKENNSNELSDNKLDTPPTPPGEEIPMMSPVSPTVPSAPSQINRLNLNNAPPANSQQRMLNPHRPMDSGY